MSTKPNDLLETISRRMRDVAIALIAAMWRGRDFGDVDRWLAEHSEMHQRFIVIGTMLALLGASLIAGSFGLLGLCVFWLLIIWLIR